MKTKIKKEHSPSLMYFLLYISLDTKTFGRIKHALISRTHGKFVILQDGTQSTRPQKEVRSEFRIQYQTELLVQ